MHRRPPDPMRLRQELAALGVGEEAEVHVLHVEIEEPPHDLGNPLVPDEGEAALIERLDRLMVRDRLAIQLGVDPERSWPRLESATMVRNREGRVKNVHDAEDQHLVSPRLLDGGITLGSLDCSTSLVAPVADALGLGSDVLEQLGMQS